LSRAVQIISREALRSACFTAQFYTVAPMSCNTSWSQLCSFIGGSRAIVSASFDNEGIRTVWSYKKIM